MMQFMKNILIVGLVIVGYMDAKQMAVKKVTPVEEISAPAAVLPVQPAQPVISEEKPEAVFEQPDISKLPKPMNAPEAEKQREEKRARDRRAKEAREKGARRGEGKKQGPKLSMADYARNKVTTLSSRLVDDIFPKEKTIERMVFEFKDEFPGPNKESDITLLYNAIINNPEIKKNITLKNAVPVYNFIKEALSKAWDKKDNLVWSK